MPIGGPNDYGLTPKTYSAVLETSSGEGEIFGLNLMNDKSSYHSLKYQLKRHLPHFVMTERILKREPLRPPPLYAT